MPGEGIAGTVRKAAHGDIHANACGRRELDRETLVVYGDRPRGFSPLFLEPHLRKLVLPKGPCLPVLMSGIIAQMRPHKMAERRAPGFPEISGIPEVIGLL